MRCTRCGHAFQLFPQRSDARYACALILQPEPTARPALGRATRAALPLSEGRPCAPTPCRQSRLSRLSLRYSLDSLPGLVPGHDRDCGLRPCPTGACGGSILSCPCVLTLPRRSDALPACRLSCRPARDAARPLAEPRADRASAAFSCLRTSEARGCAPFPWFKAAKPRHARPCKHGLRVAAFRTLSQFPFPPLAAWQAVRRGLTARLDLWH
jgi:hypothetical protein